MRVLFIQLIFILVCIEFVNSQEELMPIKGYDVFYIDTQDCARVDVVLSDTLQISIATLRYVVQNIKNQVCASKYMVIYLGYLNNEYDKEIPYKGSPPSAYLVLGRYYEKTKMFYFETKIKGFRRKVKF